MNFIHYDDRKAPGSTPIGPNNAQLQAQAQLAQAIASGNPAAIAASKHSLNMLSMASLHEPLQTQDNELIVRFILIYIKIAH